MIRPSQNLPDIQRNASLSKELSESVADVESFLLTNGFTLGHRNPRSDCLQSSYWDRISKDATGQFETFAFLCISSTGIGISISDWGRFRSSEPTRLLAAELKKFVLASKSNVTIKSE